MTLNSSETFDVSQKRRAPRLPRGAGFAALASCLCVGALSATPAQSTVAQSTVAQSAVAQSAVPQSTAPQSAVPQSAAPQSAVPQSAGPQSAGPQDEDRPVIAEALASVSEEVRTYNDHLTILASPWMEGRLPGTPGMERAMEYMEFHFRKYGLRAPFPEEVENADGTIAVRPGASYRQPFRLRNTLTVRRAVLALSGGEGVEEGACTFEHGSKNDFTATSLGSSGSVKGQAVFVGYGIDRGPDGYTSFPADLDLEGKIAVLLRFEPMGENGWSKWRNGAESWTNHTKFTGKVRAAADRGAAGIIIVNPPGTPDPRVRSLRPAGGVASSMLDIPVLHMTTEAGTALMAAASSGLSLDDCRRRADEGTYAVALPGEVSIDVDMGRDQTVAENVVGVLPGKGRLANEYVTVGAHLDHLGMGRFGSLAAPGSRGKKLHPGADDNASGCAGILLIAEKMAATYAESEGDRRSIVFIGFSAEESGLHGSQFYVRNPVAPIAQHTLMLNFDMIGRIENKRLKLSGLETGKGLNEFVAPIVESSPLTVIGRAHSGGGSDQVKFEAEGVPVLFGILEHLHDDRHTPRDVSSLINRVDAVHASRLFYDIALAAAERSEPFGFKPYAERPPEVQEERRARRPRRKVRLGVSLRNANDLRVTSVAPESTADEAGLQTGDLLLEWNGSPLTDLTATLNAARVGDLVTLTVLRDGKRTVLEPAELQANRSRDAEGPPAPAPSPQPSASPRGGSGVMFGIRPVYTDTGGGVLAESVTKDSPAFDAGLKAGDRVLTWNGEEIDGARDLGGLLRSASPGDVIEVTIERDGKEIAKKVTLRARGDRS